MRRTTRRSAPTWQDHAATASGYAVEGLKTTAAYAATAAQAAMNSDTAKAASKAMREGAAAAYVAWNSGVLQDNARLYAEHFAAFSSEKATQAWNSELAQKVREQGLEYAQSAYNYTKETLEGESAQQWKNRAASYATSALQSATSALSGENRQHIIEFAGLVASYAANAIQGASTKADANALIKKIEGAIERLKEKGAPYLPMLDKWKPEFSPELINGLKEAAEVIAQNFYNKSYDELGTKEMLDVSGKAFYLCFYGTNLISWPLYLILMATGSSQYTGTMRLANLGAKAMGLNDGPTGIITRLTASLAADAAPKVAPFLAALLSVPLVSRVVGIKTVGTLALAQTIGFDVIGKYNKYLGGYARQVMEAAPFLKMAGFSPLVPPKEGEVSAHAKARDFNPRNTGFGKKHPVTNDAPLEADAKRADQEHATDEQDASGNAAPEKKPAKKAADQTASDANAADVDAKVETESPQASGEKPLQDTIANNLQWLDDAMQGETRSTLKPLLSRSATIDSDEGSRICRIQLPGDGIDAQTERVAGASTFNDVILFGQTQSKPAYPYVEVRTRNGGDHIEKRKFIASAEALVLSLLAQNQGEANMRQLLLSDPELDIVITHDNPTTCKLLYRIFIDVMMEDLPEDASEEDKEKRREQIVKQIRFRKNDKDDGHYTADEARLFVQPLSQQEQHDYDLFQKVRSSYPTDINQKVASTAPTVVGTIKEALGKITSKLKKNPDPSGDEDAAAASASAEADVTAEPAATSAANESSGADQQGMMEQLKQMFEKMQGNSSATEADASAKTPEERKAAEEQAPSAKSGAAAAATATPEPTSGIPAGPQGFANMWQNMMPDMANMPAMGNMFGMPSSFTPAADATTASPQGPRMPAVPVGLANLFGSLFQAPQAQAAAARSSATADETHGAADNTLR